ncbi:MAG: acyltransferase family protein [Phocaeicola sp.]
MAYGSQKKQGTFFSKDYTNVLKGLCCIIVIYVHFPSKYQNAFQDAIGSFAYVAVTLFFMVSAYGMMLSVEKKKSYLNTFWRNRLVSLLIPAFLVNVVATLVGGVKGNLVMSGLVHINGYVMVLLQFCLWFYTVEIAKRKWFKNNTALGDALLIGGVAISSLYLYLFVYGERSEGAGWCFERMGLVWGIMLYRYYDRCVKWMDNRRGIKTFVLFILSLLLGVGYLHYKTEWLWGEYLLKIVLGIVIISFLFTATSNRKFGNRVSSWLGDISYEVYLSHGMMMGLLAYYYPDLQSGWFILLTVVSTLAISTLVHSVGKPMINRLRV